MSMKKMIIFLMALAVLLTIPPGCEKAGLSPEPAVAPSAGKTEKPGGGQIHADTLAAPGKIREDIDYTDVSESLRQSLWSFAGKTSAAALTGPAASNSLYSPVSLYYGLAMLEAGADGRTKAELRAFMEVHGDQAIGPELGKLCALMSIDREESIEQIANALWARKDLVSGNGGVKQSWLDQLSNDFYASAFAVDFTHPDTAKEMSRWVEQETRGKIKPEIDVSDPGLLMVLMNTLYFKAGWLENFREDEVVKGDFFGHEGTLTDISYLHRNFISLSALQAGQFTAAALPLTNGRIELILPEEGIQPEALLEDPAFLAGLRNGAWRDYGVDLKLPKFEYKSKTDILKAMESLGLPAIVKEGPDFSAMIDRGAEVSIISQEAFIALDEKGVEAAAYTEIGIVESMPVTPADHMDLHLDRPFLFVITDQAGAPLFVGVVRNPAQS